jgi:hypothetical protein
VPETQLLQKLHAPHGPGTHDAEHGGRTMYTKPGSAKSLYPFEDNGMMFGSYRASPFAGDTTVFVRSKTFKYDTPHGDTGTTPLGKNGTNCETSLSPTPGFAAAKRALAASMTLKFELSARPFAFVRTLTASGIAIPAIAPRTVTTTKTSTNENPRFPKL